MEKIDELLEKSKDTIERVMAELPCLPRGSPTRSHKDFLCGYIDCLFDLHQIGEEQHKILIALYT